MSALPSKPPIHVWPLPYEERLPQRPDAQVDLVVIHCTELPDLAMAREYGERVLYDSGAGNSGHYYVDRDGGTQLFVHPGRIANHCRGYNERSIGIELVNTGRYPDWLDSRRQQMSEAYPPAQVEALIGLLDSLRHSLTGLRWIAGHEDLDTAMVAASDDPARQVARKRDPGPLFPWPQVLAACGLERLRP
jgi:N-acetylmuramoyl-L-alanine amidase